MRVEAFERFCERGDGLYEAFQQLCDPAKVVYVLGTVEDDPHTVIHTPTLVEGLLGLAISQICCGGQHAAVLTRWGEVLTWGRGGFGRLGHSSTQTLHAPKIVGALAHAVCKQVACGFAYTAAVTTSGELYTWGAGENGRLGLGDVEDRHVPCHVEALEYTPIKEVFAGSVHTCVLTREGAVYSFGKHEYTGHGHASDVLLPQFLDEFGGSPVRQISVGPGGYHTIALVSYGEVYTWGHNRVGQLGYSNSEVVPRNVEGAYFLPKPQLVESLRRVNVKQVVAGWGHSAVLTAQGQVFICGRNYQGQLGLGDPDGFPQNERGHPYQAKFCTVEELEQKHVMQIACGGEHSVALLKNGEVYTFGAGNKGQLGHGSTNNEYFRRCSARSRRAGGSCTRSRAATTARSSSRARSTRPRSSRAAWRSCARDPELMASMERGCPRLPEVRHYPDMSQPPLPASAVSIRT